MPTQLSQEMQDRIVKLRAEGRTYGQIRKETGVHDAVISKYLKKAGLTGRSPAPADGSPPPVQVAPAARAPEPAPPPVQVTGGDGLTEFQPPPPPVKQVGRRVRVACCGATIELEGKETEADLADKPCPACGEV